MLFVSAVQLPLLALHGTVSEERGTLLMVRNGPPGTKLELLRDAALKGRDLLLRLKPWRLSAA
jgi:hypothetical protein